MDSPVICLAESSDARSLASLHRSEIPSGFLSTLSLDFLTLLYEHMIIHGKVYVARDMESQIPLGFLSSVMSTKRFYQSFLIRKTWQAIPMLFSQFFKISFIKKVVESLWAPFKSGKLSEKKTDENSLDCPELLSIAVSPSSKNKGLGSQLLRALEADFFQKEVSFYKVVAGNSLVSANAFYLKNGFQLSHQIEIHAGEYSNVYVKSLVKLD